MVNIRRGYAALARAVRARYQLICAREDAARLHLRVPSGVWFCDLCRHVLLDHDSIVAHNLLCPDFA
jgi:ribosomal protein L37AE/L43A